MSIEDELGLGRPLGCLLNQAALLDFFAVELAGVSSDEVLGAERRDALTAVLEGSALMARNLVAAFDEADRARSVSKDEEGTA